MKHTIIKEIMFECEIKLENCISAESYIPMSHENYLDSLKDAKKR